MGLRPHNDMVVETCSFLTDALQRQSVSDSELRLPNVDAGVITNSKAFSHFKISSNRIS